MSPSLHLDEAARLNALHDCRILDTPPEAAFERIVRLAADILDMPAAAVSFIDRDRQWLKAKVGVEFCETSRETSFCTHAVQSDEVLVVGDAAADPRFAENPLVAIETGVRFYAGAPIHAPGGQPLGALCVYDRRPRQLDERQRKILTDLAALVNDEIALRTEVAARQQAEQALHAEQRALKEANDSVEKRVVVRTAELSKVNRTLQSEMRQRALADEASRRSEHRFRQLFNQASDAAMVHDIDGRVVDANEIACASLGYTREELLTMGVPDFETTHDPTEGFRFWRELAPGSVEKLEGCHRRKDGSTFPVEIHVSVLETAEGRHLLALIRDITERKRDEEALRTRAHQQEALASLGARALGGGGSVDELMRAAVNLIGATLGVEICRVYEHLPERKGFVVAASLLEADPEVGTIVADDQISSFAGHVFRTRQPVVIENVDHEDRFTLSATFRILGVKSALCVLLGGTGLDDASFGLLGVGTRQPRTFSGDDVFFVQSVANVLATAIVRRRSEDCLRAVEARYQRIAANTPGVVIQYLTRLDGTSAIPFISEAVRTFYGIEPEAIQANPRLFLSIVHPDDRAGLVAAVHASKETLQPMHWQGRYVLSGGEVFWMRVDSQPERLPDGGVIFDGIIIDITGQKRRKEALRQSEERFRLAIVHSPFPVMLHADDGEIVQVNDAWTHLTGYTSAELIAIEDWLHLAYPAKEDRDKIHGHLADIVNHIGAVEHPGQRIVCADGSERIWDFTCANLDRLPDRRWLHITTAVDVTERRHAEDALRAAKEEAERANRAKSVFLSRMSHELRTPLNAILGFGQLLELSTLEKQDAMSLGYILKGGRHLLALIDEVLDLSRAETGDLHLSPGQVKVGALAQECAGLVARMAQTRGITCRVIVPATISVWTDEQRLRQMLLNLLSNAIKYNREGGEVFVHGEATSSGRLRLRVTDNGPGISAEGLERLFVPFERLEQEFTEAEGTGLGLVISRRIAEAMGGTLEVQSEVGRGSTFCIDLPLGKLPAGEISTVVPAKQSLRRTKATTPKATLLYIEDNVSNLQVVKALLANCRPRWEFLSARNGREGLEQAHQGSPDLILLDLQLPGMKGDAVLAELRHDPLTQHIPVVLLSADATAHSRERLLAMGADDYLSKPFKLEGLLELLDRTLLKVAVA